MKCIVCNMPGRHCQCPEDVEIASAEEILSNLRQRQQEQCHSHELTGSLCATANEGLCDVCAWAEPLIYGFTQVLELSDTWFEGASRQVATFTAAKTLRRIIGNALAIGAFEGEPQTDVNARAERLVDGHTQLIDSLVAMRVKHQLSQELVGTRMGVSPSEVAVFEGHGTNPTLSTVRRYALAVGAHIEHSVRDVFTQSVTGDQSTGGKKGSSK